jgi:hypothetical protein
MLRSSSAASQIIHLHRMEQANPAAAPDKRIVLKTEGRGGAPLQLLIERRDQGWHLHGDAEEVMEAQRLLEAEAKLSGLTIRSKTENPLIRCYHREKAPRP